MEIHCHLAATYPIEPWVEHFDWLDPLFNERMAIADGRMIVSDRPASASPCRSNCARGRSTVA